MDGGRSRRNHSPSTITGVYSQPNSSQHLGARSFEHDLGAAVVLNGDVGGAGLEGNCLSEGMVHGVVVQIIKSTGPSKFSRPAGLEVISKRTKMEGLVSSEYSISASASAVWQCAPMDGLVTAIDHTLIEHGLEDLDVGSVMLVIERQVGVVPVAKHAQGDGSRPSAARCSRQQTCCKARGS